MRRVTRYLFIHIFIVTPPQPIYFTKPSRSFRAAASICASSSPASTARLISSSVGTKSATVAISTALLPLLISNLRAPYRMFRASLLVSVVHHHARTRRGTSTLRRLPSESTTERNRVRAKLVPSAWLLANWICSHNLRDNFIRRTRVRHQMTQVIDSYRARFKLATTKGSTARFGSVF